jgi:hypothetical protein
MKRIIIAVAAIVLVLAFATAFADQMPSLTQDKEVGTLLNIKTDIQQCLDAAEGLTDICDFENILSTHTFTHL